ncbi:MAG: GNAT family N-acetyltransferase [Gaiellaceae bacterium]
MAVAVAIRPYEELDLQAIVDFSLRAWAPVFESIRNVLGEALFARLHQPDWAAVQADAVKSACTSSERDVFVAVVDGRPVGFAAVALNAYHERMGVVDMIAVDPQYQQRGIAARLMEHAVEHMRAQGMDIAAVGTGGDEGHDPARRLYESSGYTALPGVRYLKLLDA